MYLPYNLSHPRQDSALQWSLLLRFIPLMLLISTIASSGTLQWERPAVKRVDFLRIQC